MPRKIASRKNAKPSRANGIPKIGPANAMKPGHSRPSSNESTVPETAPPANRIAVPRAHRWARASAASSFLQSQSASAMAMSTGMPMPIAANTMWKASDIAIWERAARRSLTRLYCHHESQVHQSRHGRAGAGIPGAGREGPGHDPRGGELRRRRMATDELRRPGPEDAARRGPARRAQGRAGPPDGDRDGQAAGGGPVGGGEVRVGVPLLRGQRRALPRP